MSTNQLNQELVNRLQNSIFKANQSVNLASNSNPLCNGFLVKKFYQSKILSLLSDTNDNKNLQNNKYRAYYSSSFLPIFEQIYYQLGFDNNKITILLHPFTPVDIIDFLLSFGHSLIFFEINKESLSYQNSNKNFRKADLVVHYTFNQLLEELNNDFTPDQKIITIDSSNSINNQYNNYISSLNNSGYIQIIGANPLPSILNRIFGLDLIDSQLSIGIVVTSISNILNKEYYKTKQKELNKVDKISQDQLQFLQFFTYLLDGTITNKKIIDQIKDKIFAKHITIDLKENIQPAEAKKTLEDIFYRLQDQIYPDYWLDIIAILTDYKDSESWFDLDFVRIQERKIESLKKIVNLIRQFDKELNIILPQDIDYQDISLLHLYTPESNFCYAKFANEGINLWSLPILHSQVMNSLDKELGDIVSNCLICKL